LDHAAQAHPGSDVGKGVCRARLREREFHIRAAFAQAEQNDAAPTVRGEPSADDERILFTRAKTSRGDHFRGTTEFTSNIQNPRTIGPGMTMFAMKGSRDDADEISVEMGGLLTCPGSFEELRVCLTRLQPQEAWPEIGAHIRQLISRGVLPRGLLRNSETTDAPGDTLEPVR
jgi:hypothetical protein